MMFGALWWEMFEKQKSRSLHFLWTFAKSLMWKISGCYWLQIFDSRKAVHPPVGETALGAPRGVVENPVASPPELRLLKDLWTMLLETPDHSIGNFPLDLCRLGKRIVGGDRAFRRHTGTLNFPSFLGHHGELQWWTSSDCWRTTFCTDERLHWWIWECWRWESWHTRRVDHVASQCKVVCTLSVSWRNSTTLSAYRPCVATQKKIEKFQFEKRVRQHPWGIRAENSCRPRQVYSLLGP